MATQFDLLPGFTIAGKEKFIKRANSLIGGLNARMKKKGFAGNLPRSRGRQILAEALGRPCRYCRQVLKIATMSPDHPTPLSRGGDPFDIEIICLSCNEIKAELTAEEFQKFMAFINTLAPEGRADILRRLHAGAYGIRMMAQFAGRKFGGREAVKTAQEKTDAVPSS